MALSAKSLTDTADAQKLADKAMVEIARGRSTFEEQRDALRHASLLNPDRARPLRIAAGILKNLEKKESERE